MKPTPAEMRRILKLYLVAGTQDCRHLGARPEDNLLGVLETALQSGITCYQFREKGAGALRNQARIFELAGQCRDLCRRYGVPFVVNNDVHAAVKLGADGVHIGQGDTAPAAVEKLCGGKMFFGISNSSMDDLGRSLASSADYFACGPVYPTCSKDDAGAAVGTQLVRSIREAAPDRPLAAIGGITAHNAADVRAAGADGIAVISAVTQADDVAAAVRALL